MTARPSESPERASFRWRMALRLLRFLPQGALSRGWGWVARRRLPRPIQGTVNRVFARLVGIHVGEGEAPPGRYPSLSSYFVRRLRPGVRSWPEDPGVPGSPVDGVLGAYGALGYGRALQAKGRPYSIADLLGAESEAAAFRDGLYFTIYLSPRHYHRVHSPIGASLHTARAIPGRLLPVNPPAVRSVTELFPRNERLVTLFELGDADLALVAVGAYNVGGISAEFDPEWQGARPAGVTNLGRGAVEVTRRYDPPRPIARADELMAFHFGSTVVLLVSRRDGRVPRVAPGLREGMELRMGRPLLEEPLSAASISS